MTGSKLYLLLCGILTLWVMTTVLLFRSRPQALNADSEAAQAETVSRMLKLSEDIERLAKQVARQSDENDGILLKLSELTEEKKPRVPNGSEPKRRPATVDEVIKGGVGDDVVIPILVMACNRPAVKGAIDPLLKQRGTDPKRVKKFPIIVSQDCGHAETAEVIRGYGDLVKFIQQPNLTKPILSTKNKRFEGYYKIARHYAWALNQTFVTNFRYDQVIIVEDDLEVAPDFLDYFEATLNVLKRDPSLWCVSAWNDNGKKGLIDENRPDLLYRSDFFGGLGWMLLRSLWVDELMHKWPGSFWDDWVRLPEQRGGRACIRPEISRTKTFGKVGVSNGLFFEKHLKYIILNDRPYNFTQHDLGYLLRARYDKSLVEVVRSARNVSLAELKSMTVGGDQGEQQKVVKVMYGRKGEYKAAAVVLGIMDDPKAGVPRMGYKGIVATMYKGVRVYLTPGLDWKGYNKQW